MLSVSKDVMVMEIHKHTKKNEDGTKVTKTLSIMVPCKLFICELDMFVFCKRLLNLSSYWEEQQYKTVNYNSEYLLEHILNTLLNIEDEKIYRECELVENVDNGKTMKSTRYKFPDMESKLREYEPKFFKFEKLELPKNILTKDKIFYFELINKEYFHKYYKLTMEYQHELNGRTFLNFFFDVMTLNAINISTMSDQYSCCVLSLKNGTYGLLVYEYVWMFDSITGKLNWFHYNDVLNDSVIVNRVIPVMKYIREQSKINPERQETFEIAKRAMYSVVLDDYGIECRTITPKLMETRHHAKR